MAQDTIHFADDEQRSPVLVFCGRYRSKVKVIRQYQPVPLVEQSKLWEKVCKRCADIVDRRAQQRRCQPAR